VPSGRPGDGDANDIQDGNDGTLENGATFTAGQVDQAFSLDGVNDCVGVPSSANINPGSVDFTVDFWMRTTSSGVLRAILNKRPVCANASFWGIRLRSDGHLGIELDQDATGTKLNNFVSTIPVNDGNWHHIALVRQGSAATLYIDGAFDASQSTPGVTNIDNSADLLFGNDPCVGVDGTQFYVGELDEIEYYNRALSAFDIQDIFTAGSAGKCKLVAGLDHFLCYKVKEETKLGDLFVSLEDQFGSDPDVRVKKAKTICVPVDKNGEGINNPDLHLVCYKVKSELKPKKDVLVTNQFGEQILEVKKPDLLCVPSSKEILGDSVGDRDDDDKRKHKDKDDDDDD